MLSAILLVDICLQNRLEVRIREMKVKKQSKLLFLVQCMLAVLIFSCLLASTAVMLPQYAHHFSINDLDAIKELSWTIYLISFGIGVFLSSALLIVKIKPLFIALAGGLIYTLFVLSKADIYLALGIFLIWLLLIYYSFTKPFHAPDISRDHIPLKKKTLILIVCIGLLQITVMSLIMTARVYGFRTPTYDHGLFSQMFYQMKTDGTMVTTLERSHSLSHMAVHVSPIFYLLLPFYRLFPSPETLQVLQILVVASGIIPLLLLMKAFKFTPTMQVIFSCIYFFLPALNGSSMFDLHENCFLAPLLLWLFYALEKKHFLGLLLSTILVMAVKEDVVIYLFFIGLYCLSIKRIKEGLFVTIVPLIVFILELAYLKNSGDGTLAASRFPNVSAFPNLGLIGALPTLLLSPAYFLSQVFNLEKWPYLLQMLLPLGFTPLLQRQNPRRLILLFPFLAMNLISSYAYLHNIRFQYHYGTGTILFYLSLLFWADHLRRIEADDTKEAVRKQWQWTKKLMLAAAISLSLVSSILISIQLYTVRGEALRYVIMNKAELKRVHEVLDEIPEHAVVRATTFLTTNVSSRPYLFDLGYENSKDADQTPGDYYLYDIRHELSETYSAQIDELLETGWVEDYKIDDWILVLRKVDFR